MVAQETSLKQPSIKTLNTSTNNCPTTKRTSHKFPNNFSTKKKRQEM